MTQQIKSFAMQFNDKSPMNQFKDFDQMDTWDAKATAGESPATQEKSLTTPARSIRVKAKEEGAKKESPATQDKAKYAKSIIADNEPSTNDSLAVYMQNDYNAMYEKGEIDEPIGNWSKVAAAAEKKYPGLSKTVGNTIPEGIVSGATHSNAKVANEKYGITRQHKSPVYKDGSMAGDQSATRIDYAHPILKHMKR